MQDANVLQTAITTLGFPIVACICLGWFIWKLWTRQQNDNEKREDKLYSFMADAQAVNEKLTQTNAEFVSVLSTYKNDLDSIKSDVTEIKQNLKG